MLDAEVAVGELAQVVDVLHVPRLVETLVVTKLLVDRGIGSPLTEAQANRDHREPSS